MLCWFPKLKEIFGAVAAAVDAVEEFMFALETVRRDTGAGIPELDCVSVVELPAVEPD